MASSSSSPPTTAKRTACDRCHALKNRCIKSDDDQGSCDRCMRLQVECIYSPPLRVGRPKGSRSVKTTQHATRKAAKHFSLDTSPPSFLGQESSSDRNPVEREDGLLLLEQLNRAASIGNIPISHSGTASPSSGPSVPSISSPESFGALTDEAFLSGMLNPFPSNRAATHIMSQDFYVETILLWIPCMRM
jgi:hypothetical protein